VVFAQNAPVSTTTTVLPPYSIHMLENLRSDRDKFIVTVTLRDLTQTEGQVRLRLRMESLTHAMQTRRGAATPVYTLIPGVPLRLTNEDLRAYFLESNLEFTNMPRQLYRNNATVPQGHYRIWFEAYEARTGTHVSRGSEGVAHLHIVQHDVPLINQPQQAATIHLPESGLQHIVFQWAPRHFGAGMLTEYKLQIVEVPPGMNPEQVMQATLVPFFETTTTATSFVFNHIHPPLRLGFTYAYRIQARLRGPDEGMSMFKNNGYTPTQWFTFSQRCPEVRNVRVEGINQFAVWVHYAEHPLHERVRLRRRLDQEGSFWHYVTSDQNPMLVQELRPEQGYQYQMMAYCAFEQSNWTPIRTFTTPPAPPPLFECGAIDNTPPLVNTGVPLGRPLRRSDVVRLPQNSELRIMESTGTGPYRGWGTVFFNFFNTNLIMTFEDLQVDDAMQWITGDLISRQSRDNRFMFNLDRPQDPPTGDIVVDIPFVITANTEVTITDGDGNPITDGSSPSFIITITDPNGEEIQITVTDFPVVITDGTGAEFVVNRDGTVERKQEDILADRPADLVDINTMFYVQIDGDETKYHDGHFASLLKGNKGDYIVLRAFFDEERFFEKSKELFPNVQHLEIDESSSGILWTVFEKDIVRVIGETLKFPIDNTGTFEVEILYSLRYNVSIKNDEGDIVTQTINPIPEERRKLTVRLNVYEGGLVFFERAFPDVGNFGFDDAQRRELQGCATYRREQISDITYFVPWMSIPPNIARPASIRLRPQAINLGLPPEAARSIEIELVSSVPGLIEFNGQPSLRMPVDLFFSQIAGNIGITMTAYGRGYVLAYAVQGDIRQRIGKLEVEARQAIERTFRVVYVKKATESSFPTPSKADISHFLNNFSFNQIFVSWKPDDMTYPNQLILNNVTAQDEEGLFHDIRDAYQAMTKSHIEDDGPYYIFVVSDAVRKNATDVNGVAIQGGQISMVFNQSPITTVHELGHNLGLRHIFEVYPTITAGTSRNFMDWSTNPDIRAFFYKFQRNFIHNNHR